jgi:exodeoxyribonuclease V alpha subunit
VNELELAYAITAHKSQGNEFDTVVILLIGRHRKLHYRNLLYTAVTRARRRLVIVGDAKTVEEMVLNAQKSLRYTSLAYLLREEVDIESAGIFN